MKRKALGRGLSALIPDKQPAQRTSDFFLCPIERIKPDRDQPRSSFDDEQLEELAASIREQGVVQPLLVRPRGASFQLIAGERRWRAAQRAGLQEVPVVVRKVDDLGAFEIALVENLQRADLNPIEEAEAYRRLLDEHDYTQEKLAARLGRDRSTITNSLRLLKLPEPARRMLIAGEISAGHARAALALERPRAIQRTLAEVRQRQLSVRQTEQLVRKERAKSATKTGKKRAGGGAATSANVRDLQERLSRALHTKVRVHAGPANRGRIEIHYGSLDELDRLLEVLL